MKRNREAGAGAIFATYPLFTRDLIVQISSRKVLPDRESFWLLVKPIALAVLSSLEVLNPVVVE